MNDLEEKEAGRVGERRRQVGQVFSWELRTDSLWKGMEEEELI